jgi:dephospho-CoA kinase
MVSNGPSKHKLSKHYSINIFHGLTIGHTADVTGEINRERLGELVFNDATARRRLNRATHPAVTVEIAKQLLSHLLQCHWLVVGLLLKMSSISPENVL